MTVKDSGGPAYPFEYHNQTGAHQPGFFDTGMLAPGASQQFAGMSLRDYFAAKADSEDVVEILSEHYDAWCDSGTTRTPEYHQPSRAEARYMFADAMLAERAK